MSEDNHARGAILIDPPIPWAEVWDLKGWLSIEQRQRDAVLRVIERRTEGPDGVVNSSVCDAIIPGNLLGYDLLPQVQEIVDRVGASHTFTGHLDCSYAHEDEWRIVVRSGRAIEIRPQWPGDDDAAYEPAVTRLDHEVWFDGDGILQYLRPTDARPGAEWRRLYVRTTPATTP